MAAALGIPVVVGCQHVTDHVVDGDLIIVDGRNGLVVIRPDEQTLDQYKQDIERLLNRKIERREIEDFEATHIVPESKPVNSAKKKQKKTTSSSSIKRFVSKSK